MSSTAIEMAVLVIYHRRLLAHNLNLFPGLSSSGVFRLSLGTKFILQGGTLLEEKLIL